MTARFKGVQRQNKSLRRGFGLFLAALTFCFAVAFAARADSWSYWGHVSATSAAGPKMSTDGTNIFYSTFLDGVYRATLADKVFTAMPMTGFPLWEANTNPNGFACANVAVTPQGTVVICGSQVSASTTNIQFNPPGSSTNTLPVFYWWDETNQLWHASSITGKTYPYTSNVGNFSIAQDGSLWACSGFYPYAYRSTNGGKNFTAFDINARVPTNYLPMPSGQGTFGALFSILAGWNSRVVIGTETGGFLQTTNNGATWTSLDPNFTSTNTMNPLGRIGDARVVGLDHYGNFLLNNYLLGQFAGYTNWNGVSLIGWRPADGSYFPATNGFLASLGSGLIVTPPSGVSFTFMNQNYLLQGGVYRSPNGRDWSQFNQGSGLDFPFAPGLTNVLGQGGCITTVSNLVLIGVGGGSIYSFDSTPPPVVNRPPIALSKNVNLWANSPTNFTLTGSDADGNALNFTIVIPPARGTLTGTPPDLTYTPSNNATGPDGFFFTANDGTASAAVAFVGLAINPPTNTLSTVALTSPADGKIFIAPANLVIAAAASDPDGITLVNFYLNGSFITGISNAPYTLTLTNVAPGDYSISARVKDHFDTRTWSAPVRVTVLPVVPRASIKQVDSETVAVTWSLELDGFFIESAPDAAGPWTLSPYPPLFFTNGQNATIPLADQQFFRLMRP